MDLVSLGLSKKYTEDTVIGLGAIKGAPATISKIEKVDGGNNVTFSWTANDGSKTESQTVFIADGEKGEVGPQGPVGPKGESGKDGKDGKGVGQATQGGEIFNDYINNQALGKNSHAEGARTYTQRQNAHAEGESTRAGAARSHVEGYATSTIGPSARNAHAEGGMTIASESGAHAEGFVIYKECVLNYPIQYNADTTQIVLTFDDDTVVLVYEEYFTPGMTNALFPDKRVFVGLKGSDNREITKATVNHNKVTLDLAYPLTEHDVFNITDPYYVRFVSSRTIASGVGSHAEGRGTEAFGSASHAEGQISLANGVASHAEGQDTIASGVASHAEGQDSRATGAVSHAEGLNTIAFGSNSHAEGNNSYAKGDAAHAEGRNTIAYGANSHAEGLSQSKLNLSTLSTDIKTAREEIKELWQSIADYNKKFAIAFGNDSHIEGRNNLAMEYCSHAEGLRTRAFGSSSHAEGQNTMAEGTSSHAEGIFTQASTPYSHVEGKYNSIDVDNQYLHIVGNGTSTSDQKRSNAFTVSTTGNITYTEAAQSETGADYAEYFEWLDSNPNNEDRVGYIVTLEDDKIRLATPEDDDILGVISGTAAIIGDTASWDWAGKYQVDKFGRTIWEDVEEFVDEEEEYEVMVEETVETVDEEGNITTETIQVPKTETRIVKKSIGFFPHRKLAEGYDPSQTYIPRSKRPEWDTVGMIGKLHVRDDSTCLVGKYAKVGENGVATLSDVKTNMRVMKRVDEDVVLVLMK